MANNTKTIYGFPFISGNSLLQEQILLVNVKGTVRETQSNVVLIEDVWEELKSSTTKAKQGKQKDYWYWPDIEVTDTEDTDKTIKIKFECPKPTADTFGLKFEEDSNDSEWAAYWKAKMKDVEDSEYNNSNAVFSKKITIPESKFNPDYSDRYNPKYQDSEVVEIERTDLGDINTLLNLF